MCVHIRQPVREQPDTGYWKNTQIEERFSRNAETDLVCGYWKYAGTPMAADWMNWFLGVEGVLDLFDLGDS